jgi:prepilin-type N-terminal cleavage/methylation domain-containing protein
MKIPSFRRTAGFTLIELMAVIVIIVILAGMVVGGLGFVNERQARSKAQTQIALLSAAIEEFKLDMGRLPGNTKNTPSAGTGVSSQLYVELFYEGYDYAKKSEGGSPPNPWQKKVDGVDVPKSTRIYLPQLDPTSSKLGWVDPVTTTNAPPPASTMIRDPWGNEYRYRKGTNAQNPDFDLWSIGKDGQTNTTNPTQVGASGKTNRDDVRNF